MYICSAGNEYDKKMLIVWSKEDEYSWGKFGMHDGFWCQLRVQVCVPMYTYPQHSLIFDNIKEVDLSKIYSGALGTFNSR